MDQFSQYLAQQGGGSPMPGGGAPVPPMPAGPAMGLGPETAGGGDVMQMLEQLIPLLLMLLEGQGPGGPMPPSPMEPGLPPAGPLDAAPAGAPPGDGGKPPKGIPPKKAPAAKGDPKEKEKK